MMMNNYNDNDNKYIQSLEEEILKDSETIKITFDDKSITTNFDLQDKVKQKINDSIEEVDLDTNSIVKAPSTGKYYVKAISKEDSQSYYGVDDLVFINYLKDIISIAKNNNLTVDKSNKLFAPTVKFKKIFTESDGKFNSSKSEWSFYYPSLKRNRTYIIFIDSQEFYNYIRPLKITVHTADWKIPMWLGNALISDTSGAYKGIVHYVFDMSNRQIIFSGGFLDKDSSIYIYESVTETFYV